MKTTAKKLAMPAVGVAAAQGMLALKTSCTVVSNTSAQIQQSQKVTGVRDSSKVATTIKINGSSTVYPITKAMPAAGYAYAKDYQANPPTCCH
ncbi:hypothetical protein [Nostoc sp.]|uniref:hypothetical protein n=1 Tax=Nostoc sp. TaxID=1180 RepID=UPI003593D1E5